MSSSSLPRFLRTLTTSKSSGISGPKSAYSFFCSEHYKSVSSSLASTSLGDVARGLSTTWRSLTDRSKYEALASADMLRYKAELSQLRKVSDSEWSGGVLKLTSSNLPVVSNKIYKFIGKENKERLVNDLSEGKQHKLQCGSGKIKWNKKLACWVFEPVKSVQKEIL